MHYQPLCAPFVGINESGSVTMFVLLMTMTMAMLFAALVTFGTTQTRHAEMLRTLELASQSVLHTYDRQLLESYSLLAVDLEFVEPSAYLTTNSGPNLRRKRPGRAWTFEPLHTLEQPSVFLEAVRQAVAVGIADEVLKQFSERIDAVPQVVMDGPGPAEALISGAKFEDELTESSAGETDKTNEEVSKGATKEDRALASEAITWIRQVNTADGQGDAGVTKRQDSSLDRDHDPEIDRDYVRSLGPEIKARLPSHAYKGYKSGLSPTDRVSFVFYVARHFRDRVSDHRTPFYKASPPAPFFESELEYILYGHEDESFNSARAYADVYLMRLSGNIAHVLACREKRGLIETLAGAVNAVVGVPAPITASALTLTWGMAESRSDLGRLLNGETLPWVHVSEGEWRTGFGAAGHETAADGQATFKRDDPTRAGYGDHLSALLMAKASTSHVLRAMDLISIGNGAHGADLGRRATRFAIRVEAAGGLPEVVWEDGYDGLD